MKEDDDDPIATMARTAAAAANAQDGNDGNHSKKRRGSTLAAIVSSNATEKLTATQQFNKMYVYKSKKVIDLSVLDNNLHHTSCNYCYGDFFQRISFFVVLPRVTPFKQAQTVYTKNSNIEM